MELVEDERLQGKGYVIVTDNVYSRPALFRELKQRGFGACGTTQRDRRGIPPTVCDVKLQRGDVISSTDDGILSLKWKDKLDVTMLSTYHDDSMVTKNRRSRAAQGGVEDILKPKVVKDYNKNMGGVDKSKWLLQFLHDSLIVFWKSFGSIMVYSHVPALEFHCHSTCILLTGYQLILYYGFSHRSVKWWKRAFFHLFDLALLNSHILFQVATSSKTSQLEFRISVATSLLEGLEHPCRRHHDTATELPVHLTERAFPAPSHLS